MKIRRLIFGRLDRDHVHAFAVPVEPDMTFRQREYCKIPPKAHVPAGQKPGAALTDNDIARYHAFAAKTLDAKPFTDAVPVVLRTALSFFVSHTGEMRS